MPLTLAQMLALFNDNTSGDISAADGRDVVTALYDWVPPVEKYKTGRLAGETAHANDDFFEDDTLAGTAINHSATATWSEKYGRMSVKVQDNASPSYFVARVFSMTPSAAPVTLETCWQSFGSAAVNEQSHYFGFSEGNTSTSKILGWLYYVNGTSPTIYEVEGTFASVGFTANYAVHLMNMGPLFFRCVWTATDTVKIGVSPHPDLFTGLNIAAHVRAAAISPTHYFVGAGNIDTAIDMVAAWDFIRINEADLSP